MPEKERQETSINVADSQKPAWMEQAQAAAAAEKRWQPWKKNVEGDKVNSGFEGEDKIKTRCDDDVQHSTAAA
ncbi:hypothetical protein EPUS_00840 [Endocarpon pusillum Z07020]|uniref:Uncharacterized protein n=1 Tax=Endocarpon pusillum (strain Z07020 / HMAS-L-300199) TaxID=1263415 RepID=U1HVJ3_ENDPU|nr:uncharacterized protein EPUS_00840 [Endocarpon pusillum Z07020]ERF74710.1 hypothetical protein EPUS_00840 [Endocarpon pusillum Z07020]